jgi:hypothetical protein
MACSHTHTHTHTHSPGGCPLTQLKKYKKKIVNDIEKKKPLLKIVNRSENNNLLTKN